MNRLVVIAQSEWRYWFRSRLITGASCLFAVLLLVTCTVTFFKIEAQHEATQYHQKIADDTFASQPDRHPHRMVHYGHYVYRTPAPLAIFEPGLNSVTGQTIFLEGHRQNSAAFAESGASADFGGVPTLTPAFVYQVFAPLLIILLAHSAVSREREAGVLSQMLAQGLNGRMILFGKALAIYLFSLLVSIPVFVIAVISVILGENVEIALLLVAAYVGYLALWILFSLVVSALLIKRTNVISALVTLWLTIVLVLPSFSVNLASSQYRVAGKIENDIGMLDEMRKQGDGHNANDPAFQKMREKLFEQYGVDDLKSLPVNFRGLAAMESEKSQARVLKKYAEMRMAEESQQADIISRYAWLSPAQALAEGSRALSGTDLTHYHQFLREAEILRYQFVQGLNRLHADVLSYQDDINRNKDEASAQKARIDSDNWKLLDEFSFDTLSASERITNASSAFIKLGTWCVFGFLLLLWVAGRLKP
jgi:ABC-2 type transport system permease protein